MSGFNRVANPSSASLAMQHLVIQPASKPDDPDTMTSQSDAGDVGKQTRNTADAEKDERKTVKAALSCIIDGNTNDGCTKMKAAAVPSTTTDSNVNDVRTKKKDGASSSTTDGNVNDGCTKKKAAAVSSTTDGSVNGGCTKEKAAALYGAIDDSPSNECVEKATAKFGTVDHGGIRDAIAVWKDEELVGGEGGPQRNACTSIHYHYHAAAPDARDKYSWLDGAAKHTGTLEPPPIKHDKKMKVALQLNSRRLDGKDWRALLHHFQLGALEGTLSNSKEPGMEIMNHIMGYGCEAIIEALQIIGRGDLADILKTDESVTTKSSSVG